jgi:glutamate racemase
MTDPRPLLFFDSGVGGLSVLEATQKLLPTAPIVYAADNAGYPYGTKTEAEIAARVPALLGRLVERYRPRLVVVACNTASTIALTHVRAALEVPVVGTVPAIKPAASASKTRAIGVLGTDATIRQPYVDRLAAEFAGDCLVLRHGSAELVDLAEAKLRGEATDPAAYARILRGLTDQPGGGRIDTVVLACTHFRLIEPELRAAAPLAYIDGADGIARRVAFLTKDQDWPATPPEGTAAFTRLDAAVEPLRPALVGFGLDHIVSL